MFLRKLIISAVLTAIWPCAALAHASEQGFVLLLPTEAYRAAGVAAVVVTVLALVAISPDRVRRWFAPTLFSAPDPTMVQTVTSLCATLVLFVMIGLGFGGPPDPLSNLMPLIFWVICWAILVTLCAVLGDIAAWINPWTGLVRLAGLQPLRRLPAWVGQWPAVVVLALFAAFLLADVAPDDPGRLARIALAYWLVQLGCVAVWGTPWLTTGELGCVLSRQLAQLAPVRGGARAGAGLPGWRLVARRPSGSAAVFALVFLGVGSFDGLNETFWWFGQIGVNPLAFPGRSAVVWPTVIGLALTLIALVASFGLCVWLGARLAQLQDLRAFFNAMAVCVLPIALVYHFAHYLTYVLVGAQYVLAALSDPLARGADLLGISPFYVTTGFFNRIDTVRTIWLTQAGAVVVGHMWSVLLAHRMALTLGDGHRRAVRATLPVSIFMIAYTFLGLWLLAAPKGA